jgi:membrane protein
MSSRTEAAMAAERQIAEKEPGRGRLAHTPLAIPARGWWDILWRVWHEIGEDRIFLIAAGATFYLLLALFPALAAFVSLYGFVADPRTIADHIDFLGNVLPSGGYDLVRGQLETLAAQSVQSLSIRFVTGLLVAFWSAMNGIKSLFEGLNVAYGEREKRSFLMVNIIAFVFTIGAMLVGIAMLVSVGVIPTLLALLSLDHWTEAVISLMRWPILLVVVGAGITVLFRYGPSRARAKWRWVTYGAAMATVVWLLASWGFSHYLRNFADYNATYGSLGAVIGFLMWTWISVVILLVGAELNAELEHQTARDTTTGSPRPLGERGAVMADTVGEVAARSSAGQ